MVSEIGMDTVYWAYIIAAFFFGFFVKDLIELFLSKGKLSEEEWLEMKEKKP
tara:strand:+ start:357 stop:512 length:156 start_codon:yes stop_codon:yes gene_type:complete